MLHRTVPPQSRHEYFREGDWTCLAAWEVHRAKASGRCEVKNGMAPFMVAPEGREALFRFGRRSEVVGREDLPRNDLHAFQDKIAAKQLAPAA